MDSTYSQIQSERYRALLKRPEWFRKRYLILRRDGEKCINCGSKSQLNVHHKQYHAEKSGKLIEPWNYKLKYLVTLCRACHMRGHQKYQVRIFKIK